MRFFFIIPVLLFATSFMQEERKMKIFIAGDSTMSIKDVKAYPETGWGMPFVHFWDSSVIVVNRAKNGRSTKTFISEGLWKSVVDEATEGDMVLIQFGHNDESKEKTERYTTPKQFSANLTGFVTDCRNRKALPILITPVSRRWFDSTGNALETHREYSRLTKEVAAKMNVPLIDLDERSRALYQQFGSENSKLLFLHLRKGEHPNYPEGKNDNTHFNELGARLIAQIVLEELLKLEPGLKERLAVPKKK